MERVFRFVSHSIACVPESAKRHQLRLTFNFFRRLNRFMVRVDLPGFHLSSERVSARPLQVRRNCSEFVSPSSQQFYLADKQRRKSEARAGGG